MRRRCGRTVRLVEAGDRIAGEANHAAALPVNLSDQGVVGENAAICIAAADCKAVEGRAGRADYDVVAILGVVGEAGPVVAIQVAAQDGGVGGPVALAAQSGQGGMRRGQRLGCATWEILLLTTSYRDGRYESFQAGRRETTRMLASCGTKGSRALIWHGRFAQFTQQLLIETSNAGHIKHIHAHHALSHL